MSSVLVLLLLLLLTAAHGHQQQVLVLGGNGFIGAECVTALLATGRYNVTVVSRGTAHYDAAVRVWPHVARITCDRYPRSQTAWVLDRPGALQRCPQLAAELGRADAPGWDFVIDFSAYDGEAVTEALDALGDLARFYIFISSDSVYEVSEPSAAVFAPEEAAVRPADPDRRRRLAERDSYGDGKLAGEEVLRARHVPYLVLRLPDVLGSRDTSLRWWTYQLWLEHGAALGRPVPLSPTARRLRTSYVYVEDVARALLAGLERAERPDVRGHAFNLAHEQPLSLSELLSLMATELAAPTNATAHVADEAAPRFLPSVTRGPISVERAHQRLDFTATSWPEVVRHTVQFYRRALVEFPRERSGALRRLLSAFGDDPEATSRLLADVERRLLDGTFGRREEL